MSAPAGRVRRNGATAATLVLTPREQQVWDLAMAGKTTREIAAALGCSVNSVHTRFAVARDKVYTAAACELEEGGKA